LPTDVIIAPLAGLWGVSPQGLDAEGEARTLLRKYLWRSCFTDRYERTSATRALADFRELKSLLEGNKEAKPPIFNEEEWPLPTVEQLILSGWPTKKDRLPRALMALSLRALAKAAPLLAAFIADDGHRLGIHQQEQLFCCAQLFKPSAPQLFDHKAQRASAAIELTLIAKSWE
jgi:hypothetical protein